MMGIATKIKKKKKKKVESERAFFLCKLFPDRQTGASIQLFLLKEKTRAFQISFGCSNTTTHIFRCIKHFLFFFLIIIKGKK
jgi:hypothetical protein